MPFSRFLDPAYPPKMTPVEVKKMMEGVRERIRVAQEENRIKKEKEWKILEKERPHYAAHLKAKEDMTRGTEYRLALEAKVAEMQTLALQLKVLKSTFVDEELIEI